MSIRVNKESARGCLWDAEETIQPIMPPQQRQHIMSSGIIIDNEFSATHSATHDANLSAMDNSKLMMMATAAVAAEHAASGIAVTKKRTRFALANNEIFHIPHINDMSDEEVLGVWYEKVDYDTIKQSIIPIVKRMMKGEAIEETNEMTIRGLEYRTRKGAIRRQHNKVEAITAVLDEQDRQIELDINDPELISQVYVECSAHCLREAQELAAGDIAEALDYVSAPSASSSSLGSVDGRSPERGAERKGSITKMFQKMGIRRRTTLGPGQQGDHSPVRSDNGNIQT